MESGGLFRLRGTWQQTGIHAGPLRRVVGV